MGDPSAQSPTGLPQGPVALYDQGFYNIGVTPAENDLGIGGSDPFGNPLSFTRGLVRSLNGQSAADAFFINPCTFEANPCVRGQRSRSARRGGRIVQDADAAQRRAHRPVLPQRRLRDARLGRRVLQPRRQPPLALERRRHHRLRRNDSNLDQDIFPLLLGKDDRDAIVAFLKSLTDERVRWEKAPFDHPSLKVPHGSAGDEYSTTMNSDGTAKDSFLTIPAVGAAGRAAKGLGPLQPFTPKS